MRAGDFVEQRPGSQCKMVSGGALQEFNDQELATSTSQDVRGTHAMPCPAAVPADQFDFACGPIPLSGARLAHSTDTPLDTLYRETEWLSDCVL